MKSSAGTNNSDELDFSIDQSLENQSNINLKWLVHTIYEAKTTILISMFAFAILAAILFLYLPIKVKATLDLKKISITSSSLYDELNSITKELYSVNEALDIAYNKLSFTVISKNENPSSSVNELAVNLVASTKEDEATSRELFFSIDSDFLLNSFAEALSFRTPFIEAITQEGLLKSSDYDTDEDFQNAIIETAYDIRILQPTPIVNGVPQTLNNFRPYWTIEYAAHDGDKLRSVIFNALDIANQNVRQDLIIQFNQFVKLAEKDKKSKIDNINQAIKLRIAEYDREMLSHIENLKEQAGIARVLGISKNAVEARSFSSDNQIIVIEQKPNEELFFRGYEALEREILQIQDRKDNVAFTPGILPLETLKLRIAGDSTLDRMKDIYKNTPLADDNFRAANYQKFGIKIIEPKTRYLIPIIIFVLGLLSVVMFVLVRKILR